MFKSATIRNRLAKLSMLQLLQSLADGRVVLEEIPVPMTASGAVLIRTSRSLISSEPSACCSTSPAVDRQDPPTAGKGASGARQDEGRRRPRTSKRSAANSINRFRSAIATWPRREAAPASGNSLRRSRVSNGNHAEYVAVGRNLCARIPDSVGDDEAAFVPLAAIALQGLRLAAPRSEKRLRHRSRAHRSDRRTAAARERMQGVPSIRSGKGRAGDALRRRSGRSGRRRGCSEGCRAFFRGQGIDAVLIAAATDSNDPIEQAARMCRQRGRIVLIGVTGLELNARILQEGNFVPSVVLIWPGRHDETYESRGIDYPFGLVRWTEQRLPSGAPAAGVRTARRAPLISHRFDFGAAGAAYDLLTDRTKVSLGILLEYKDAAEAPA